MPKKNIGEKNYIPDLSELHNKSTFFFANVMMNENRIKRNILKVLKIQREGTLQFIAQFLFYPECYVDHVLQKLINTGQIKRMPNNTYSLHMPVETRAEDGAKLY